MLGGFLGDGAAATAGTGYGLYVGAIVSLLVAALAVESYLWVCGIRQGWPHRAQWAAISAAMALLAEGAHSRSWTFTKVALVLLAAILGAVACGDARRPEKAEEADVSHLLP
jgi:hypothetical protein